MHRYQGRHAGHPLTSGQLFLYPVFCGSRVLLPMCDEQELPVRKAPFRFHIREGEVLFAQLSLP
jgi:hypothetical protein